MYKVWKEQPQIVGLQVLAVFEQQNTREKQISIVKTLRALTSKVDARQHTTYQLCDKDVFRDEGRTIAVLDLQSNAGIAAALAVAQQKFGKVLELTGSDEFKKNAVAVAVQNNLTCRFADPALDKLREQFQAAQYQALRDAARPVLTSAPLAPIHPSTTREAVPPLPQTLTTAELARAEKKAARAAQREAEAKAAVTPDAGPQTLDLTVQAEVLDEAIEAAAALFEKYRDVGHGVAQGEINPSWLETAVLVEQQSGIAVYRHGGTHFIQPVVELERKNDVGKSGVGR